MLLVLGLACLAAAAFLLGEVVTLPARERRTSLRRALALEPSGTAAAEEKASFRERVLEPLGGRLAGLALRLSPKTSLESVGTRLLAAGIRDVSARRFLAFKGGAAVGGSLLGLILGAASGFVAGFALALALGGVGLLAPDFVLSSRARRRADTIQAELPDALDLLAVSVEAGLGFDAALSKLTEHMEGPLVDEFARALSEIRMGRGRHQALRQLTERVDSEQLASLARAVIQADQLGISLSRILKAQADDARLRRQLAAEEKAMKAPVKMLFPTVLFIFPAMFIVVLGPAMLNFGQVL